jgi:2-polyprenyl-6-hydroxyphenyl methylase/3-demethylubiquinone-9 3-methyltransferase
MAARRPDRPAAGTASAAEVAWFAARAAAWWDPDGPFRPLHRFNPARLAYVRDRLAAHFGRDPEDERPLDGLTVLDIGCGGGLLSEPVTRLGARVTGIDAAEENVRAAAHHAEASGLTVDYRRALPEDLMVEGRTFDAVLNMEVVEHVPDVGRYMAACGALVRPGGAMVVATLNRTLKSLALAKVGAEYVLRWLPPGTHDWRRFVRPSELAAALRANGFSLADLSGMTYHPLTDEWRLGRDLDVNYLALAVKE